MRGYDMKSTTKKYILVTMIMCGFILTAKLYFHLTSFARVTKNSEIRVVEPISSSGGCTTYRVRKIINVNGYAETAKEFFFTKCVVDTVIKEIKPGSRKLKT
jgi:hypothetical protein